jgi:hypothetical protein
MSIILWVSAVAVFKRYLSELISGWHLKTAAIFVDMQTEAPRELDSVET